MNYTDLARTKAWAYLSRVVEGPSRSLNELLQQGRDPEAIAQAIKKRESWLGPLLAETESRYNWDRAEQDLAIISQLSGRLISPDDQEWPTETFATAFGFAASGRSDQAHSYQADAIAPHTLWVRGAPLRPLCAQSVSVVGTRAASQYGTQATRLIVGGLVDCGWTVISGGALGIDTVVHTEALNRNGCTIAVLACGLDRHYPARNTAMFKAMASRNNGAVVTEYPPGVAPQRHRFLTLNRLVAALSLGTVVTEAAWRSGALNTLSWAAAFGRVTMAVPGPITTSGSLGCHERIRRGEAEMVCSADEVRELVSKIGEVDVGGQYEFAFAANEVQKLSRNELRVFDALDAATAISAETVAQEAGLTVKLTVHLLVELVQRGLVLRQGGGWMRA